MQSVLNDGLKAVPDGWTVVLAGAWNTQIFQPDWVARQIFGAESVELQIALTPSVLNLRYIAADATLVVHGERLIFGAKHPTKEGLSACELYANKVIELLPHTPISAIGVNFAFMQDAPSDEFVRIFDLVDNGPLSDADMIITSSQINRAFRIGNATLNLQLSLDGARLNCLFNFHFDRANWIAGDEVVRTPRLLSEVDNLLENVYNTTWVQQNG